MESKGLCADDMTYRDRLQALVKHEAEVSNQRTNWLTASQAILFTAAAAFFSRGDSPGFVLLALAGILSAFSIGHALRNAYRSRKHFKKLWRDRVELRAYDADDALTLDGGDPLGKVKRWLLPDLVLPWIFIGAWLLLLAWHAGLRVTLAEVRGGAILQTSAQSAPSGGADPDKAEYCLFYVESWCMTRGEWAAWAQAWGTVLAIVGTVLVARYQANKQHQSAMDVLAAQGRNRQLELAATLRLLADRSVKVVDFIARRIDSRERLYDVAESAMPAEWSELQALERWIEAVPIHDLPPSLVHPTMQLNTVVRQFIGIVRFAINEHRKMDAASFETFIRNVGVITGELNSASTQFDKMLRRLHVVDER
jgi:hypothetical protein